MTESDWTDRIVGERMELDREFAEKVGASNFSRQQWGLIMTAVEFDVENPGDPDDARLVADTSKVESVVPELDRMEGAGGAAPGGETRGESSSGSGGFLSGVRSALGFDDVDDEQLAAAEEMAQMYADDLEGKLRARGRWDEVREAAGDQYSSTR